MRRLFNKIDNKIKIIILVCLFVLLVVVVVVLERKQGDSTDTSQFVAMSEQEKCLKSVLNSMEGVGKTEVFINMQDGEVVGVIVVCEGANDIWIKSDVLNAVSTALQIPKKIIAIYKMTA